MIDLSKLKPDGDDITPEIIDQNIQVPDDLKEPYQRVVLAGKKIMFDKKSHQKVREVIQGDGPLGVRLGKGIATLMLMLYNESQATMPPAVIIPAGVNLLGEAVDYIRKTKMEEINNNVVAQAIQVFVEAIVQSYGGDTNKMYSLFDQIGQQQAQEGGQGTPPARQQPMPGGM